MADTTFHANRGAPSESDLRLAQQRLVDETLDETFPASDPPAWTMAGSASSAARAGPGAAPLHPAAGFARRAPAEERGSWWPPVPGDARALVPVLLAAAAGYALARWLHGGSGGTGDASPSRNLSFGRRAERLSARERERAEAHLLRTSRAAGATGALPDEA